MKSIICTIILVVTVRLCTAYELICDKDFSPAESYRDVCTLRDATDADLRVFGAAGIPEGSHLQIKNPAFTLFDQTHFDLFERAENITFWAGTVRSINFKSTVLKSLDVLYSWLVRFTVAREENYTLKILVIRSDLFEEIAPSIRFLRGLQRVDFKGCGLKLVKMKHFAKMDNLQSLDLSDNKIHTVLMKPGMQLGRLELLEIGRNELSEIANFPKAFPVLKSVNLAKNRWYCDWVSVVRDAIWTEGITVQGAETACSNKFRNNGGLCCMDRPRSELPVESVLQEIIAKVEEGVVEALQYEVDEGSIHLKLFIQRKDTQTKFNTSVELS